MVEHHCHAIGCDRQTPRHLLMCPQHWAKVPPKLKADVLAAFVPEQCRPGSGVTPSRTWYVAAARARADVARQEGRHEAADWLAKIASRYEDRPEGGLAR